MASRDRPVGRAGWPSRSPAALAALVLAAAGIVRGFGQPVVAYLTLAGGVSVLGGGIDSRRTVWAAVTALIGLRLLASIGALEADVRRWARLAAEGEEIAARLAIVVDRSYQSRSDRWSARGTVVEGPRPTVGASLLWRGEGRAPVVGERWVVHGEVRPEPLRARPGARYPPAGLGPASRRGTLEVSRRLDRSEDRTPLLATADLHLRRRIDVRFGRLAPTATALLLGDRNRLDPALLDAFTLAGARHLLAVSGLHVGFLAGIAITVLGLVGVGGRTRTFSVGVLLFGYSALVGARPSVVRATIMTVVVLAARAGERRLSPWQAWGLAAGGILAWRPGQLFDLGFGLSFAAVAGLIAVAGDWARRLVGSPPERDRPNDPGRALVGVVGEGLAATTSASIATLPLQAVAFGWLAPAGFLLNPVLVPLVGIGLPLAWLALAGDAVGAEALAAPLSRAAGLALGSLEAVVATAARRPWTWVPGPGGWGLAGLAGLAAAAALGRRRPRVALQLSVCGLGLLIAARPPSSPSWEVVWLDVGQGDAIVLHLPEGSTWVVDAGPAGPFGDAGRSVVVPYLRRRGVGAVERLITTHADLDHVGGAASLVRGIPVRRWGSAGPVAGGEAWLELLSARGPDGRAPIAERLVAGVRIRHGTVTADVLHPGPGWIADDPYASRIPENEASVVLLLSDGRCRLLLTGDLGEPAERHLVAALGDSLRADLLHVGHHGSRHSSSFPFLERVGPRHAVVSAGSRNRFGHPHPDAMRRLRAAGAEIHRTDRRGSLSARCGRDGWRVAAMSP